MCSLIFLCKASTNCYATIAFLSTCYVEGTALSTLYMFIHFLLTAVKRGQVLFYLHFTGKEIETLGVKS